ncbi:MAG: bifunctional oligoribonuclease/PAP phosphatase NrnA [Elusimicrobia bacterium]|nr:bifunctional oligoribonuclease/PAP phosphatase NrnA [Elusimicrobiota bacterium]
MNHPASRKPFEAEKEMLRAARRNDHDRVIAQILKAVEAGRTFFLSGHERPDGDTVGSELAFASLLRRMGKKADIYNSTPVPRSLQFLPGVHRVKTAARIGKTYDVAVIFECTGADRMGNIIDLDTQARTVINIDHHAHHSHFGHINLINPKASSNSEQLYHVFQKAGMPITKEEAMALYVGLVTDTGRFQQENTNPDSHVVAAGLLATGIHVAEISRRLYSTAHEPALKLLGRALSRQRLEANGQISVMTLRRRDFRETGADEGDTEDMINYGLMIPTVQAVVFARELKENGQVKISFRGKGRVDLCRIAVRHGGGGHRNAAGVTLSGSLEVLAEKMVTEIAKTLPPKRVRPE